MFKGMKGATRKKINETKPMNDSHLFRVRSAKELLSTDKRLHAIKKIQGLVSPGQGVYETQYLKAINNFAEFVQDLPETKSSFYSYAGGLLDHGLERAAIALSLCHAFLIPDASQSSASPLEELWLYAVFTAALLLDVAKVAVKQEIVLCTQDGKAIKTWLACEGTMVGKGQYYKYDFLKENRDRLQHFLTPILARQRLTDGFEGVDNKLTGFNWIASNRDVLETWLAMLNHDHSGGGKILTFVLSAEAQTIAAYFAEMKKASSSGKGLFSASDLQNSQMNDLAAINFLNWLKSNIDSGQEKLNQSDADLQKLNEGMFISEKLFEKFAEKSRMGSWENIANQFIHLGITTAGGLSHLIQVTESSQARGVIVPTAYLHLLGRVAAAAPISTRAINITPASEAAKAMQQVQAKPGML